VKYRAIDMKKSNSRSRRDRQLKIAYHAYVQRQAVLGGSCPSLRRLMFHHAMRHEAVLLQPGVS
jgi:hypothetical protein